MTVMAATHENSPREPVRRDDRDRSRDDENGKARRTRRRRRSRSSSSSLSDSSVSSHLRPSKFSRNGENHTSTRSESRHHHQRRRRRESRSPSRSRYSPSRSPPRRESPSRDNSREPAGSISSHNRSSARHSRSSRRRRRSLSRSDDDRENGDASDRRARSYDMTDDADRRDHRYDDNRERDFDRDRDHRDRRRRSSQTGSRSPMSVSSNSRYYRDDDRVRDHDRRRDRDRDRGRGKDWDRYRDRGRDGSRERARFRDRRHHHHSRRDRRRDGSYGPDSRYIDEDRSYNPRRDGPARRSSDASLPGDGQSSKRSSSPPLSQLERDKRTVFVGQLAARLRDQELKEFFSQAGKVRDVRVIIDRISRRSKGVGYVEFYDESSVPAAIALNGQRLMGIPVIVQPSEAEKNRTAEGAAAVPSNIFHPGSSLIGGNGNRRVEHRLYVGSIHFNLTEDDLRQVFEPFGPLDYVNLQRDPETGRSKGFAFIQFKDAKDAKMALERMNGMELFGRTIKVGLVADRYQNSGQNNASFNLDDGETAGMTLTSASRAELMARLARDQEPKKGASSKRNGSQAGDATQIATRCVLLVNMFDPAEETEENWDKDIEEDVRQECEEKYGPVVHIAVNKESAGHVYIKFNNNISSEKALKSLNGRWFSSRQVGASYLQEMAYNTLFADAAYV